MLWMCSAILKLAGSLGAEEEGVMTTWPMESRTGPQKSLIADRGQRNGGEEDHRGRDDEHRALLADRPGCQRPSQACGHIAMLGADLPGGRKPQRAPATEQQQAGDSLPHQCIEKHVVRRFVREIGERTCQCGGLVVRE